MYKAYSLLTVKSVDPDRRLIRGIATTPSPDRSGDIVEPLGAQFPKRMPLLLHHDPKLPVGHATFDPPTKTGIAFEAEFPVLDTPGLVRDRINEAWDSVNAGLILGVSIGFRAIGDSIEQIKGGGLRFLKTEILELSLVTIPANAEATLAVVKSLDLAASGLHTPGVTGSSIVRVPKGAHPMTIQEQITQFENTRAAKAARMVDIQTKAEGRTKDEKEREEFNTLEREIASVDLELVDLRKMETLQVAKAIPITAATTPAQASDLRGGQVPAIQVRSMLPKGTAFTRYAMAIAATRGNKMEAIEYAKQWRDSTPEVEMMIKAAVAPGTTTDATWAAPLVPVQTMMNEFLELLRPATVIGRIPNLRSAPFNVAMATQTAGGTYNWTGEAKPKPVSALGFGKVTLGENKITGIIVISQELVRRSSPSAEEAVRGDMIAGVAQFMDQQFTDPAVAAVAGVNPASITNGTVAIASSGPTGANAETDLKALVGSFTVAGLSAAGAVLLLSETNAFALSTMKNPLGQPLYPGITVTGGSIMGLTAVASQALGTNMVLVDPRGILYADEGRTEIDVSNEASVQMDSAPDSPATATTVMVSLWQNNLVGLRCERFCSWARARLTSVKYVSGAAYV